MTQENLTPLMRQYWDVKNQHPDKILLFRMGDFFEMFFDDAVVAAPILGIALTSRNKKAQDETPMCGVPHHSIAGQINKLLAVGKKVAICDQIEDPKFAKGIVKRAVTRILTPGVVFDPDTLEPTNGNYLSSWDDGILGFLDISSGEAFYYEVAMGSLEWQQCLLRHAPAEILLDKETKISIQKILPQSLVTIDPILSEVSERLVQKTGAEWPRVCQQLLRYAITLQGEEAIHTVLGFEKRGLSKVMQMSKVTERHLEIFENYRGAKEGTLFWAVDRCKTSAGSRLLKSWMQLPLTEIGEIVSRQTEVKYWVSDIARLKTLRGLLQGVGDIHRRLGKIASPSCHPRDILAIANSFQAGLEASTLAFENRPTSVDLQTVGSVLRDIHRVLKEDIPLQFKTGGFIKSGVSQTLDELVELSTNAQGHLLELEARERELTGIGSLKIRYNNVFGYYIEVTHTHKDKVPKDRYQRKQTLANAERFLTPELELLEGKILTAEAKQV